MNTLFTRGSHTPFYILFFFSGISGLIYESVWAKYLKLFLGHSSYGQLLTLCIYMGGLGLGSFNAGKFSARLKNPLLAYAAVELLIASSGFLFHPLYVFLTESFYSWSLLPQLSSVSIEIIKISLSCLMTLPFAILLGMTFPWMVAGLMRLDGDSGEKSVAGLYYFNAGGAMLGILLASFFLVPTFGVRGALTLAASLNGILGFTVVFLCRKEEYKKIKGSKKLREENFKEIRFWLLLSFLTGLTSFIYEIVWIRMLSLMLGSSTHSFDLMVSAFIAGLAWGAFRIRKKMQKEVSWSFLLARAQWLMGGAALLSLVFYPLYFWLMNESNEVFLPSHQSYVLWSWFRYFMCLAWMVPTSFFAGQTLPLLTCFLQRKFGGEQFTGKVYGWNTLGAIMGASLAGLFLMPYFGLKGSLWMAGTFDVLTGLYVWWKYTDKPSPGIGLVAAGCVIFATLFVPIDNQMITAGMFRGFKDLHRHENMKIAHGKSATISFHETAVHKYIKTNGKPDASISKDMSIPLGSDQLTQAGTAFYPMATFHQPYRAAVIGFGSGMSVDYLLADPLLQSIDMIEIEPQMVELAKGFLPDNQRAFDDPRVRFIYDDARTYFYKEQKQYDLILSVPSNPWVSGVSSLFTQEFYQQVNHFLSQEGLLVQWIQLYEFNSNILMTILNTIDQSFSCVKFYLAPGGSDLLLLAGDQCKTLDASRFEVEPLRSEIIKMKHSAKIFSEENLLVKSAELRPFLRSFPVNSDFDPQIDYTSEEARFRKEYASFFEGFHSGYLSYREIFAERESSPKAIRIKDTEHTALVNSSYFEFLLQKENWSVQDKAGFSDSFRNWTKTLDLNIWYHENYKLLTKLSQKVDVELQEYPEEIVEYKYFLALAQRDWQEAYRMGKSYLEYFYPHTLSRELLRSLLIVAIKEKDLEMQKEIVEKGLKYDQKVDQVELKWLQSMNVN